MKEVVILTGPTGAGKTEASVILAGKINAEIISADSMQVYRGMDIGTAKPSPELRARVRHHLIDICEPLEEFSAGRFREECRKIIESLHRKEIIPLIVGGTGLYIRSITRGLFNAPSADWELRERLLRMEKERKGSLYEYLRELDPDAAMRIMPSDIRRIIRAIEVILKTQKKITELQRSLTEPLPYRYIKIGIKRERKELYRMIEDRVDEMVRRGLFDEAESIWRMNPSRTVMQAIGYKEIFAYLRGEIKKEEAVRLIKKRTKLYAKRQFTWFKKEEGIHWMDVTGIYSPEIIAERIHALYMEMKGKET